jgi:hypothetical protein
VNAKALPEQAGRRNGMTIEFTCEGCGNGLELTIAQHNGATYLQWHDALPAIEATHEALASCFS